MYILSSAFLTYDKIKIPSTYYFTIFLPTFWQQDTGCGDKKQTIEEGQGRGNSSVGGIPKPWVQLG